MMIFIGGDYASANLSQEEINAQMGKWFAWVEKLQKDGTYVGGKALTPAAKSITSQTVVTDGPFAEASELVSGYFVIKADNMESAAEIAKDFPDFDYGGKVEVREVMVFE